MPRQTLWLWVNDMRSFITTVLFAFLFVGLLSAQSAQTRPTVIALPLQAGPGLNTDETDLGYAVQNVIENVLLAHGGIDYDPAFGYEKELLPSAHDLQAWVHSNPDAPKPKVAKLKCSILFRGRVRRDGNELWADLDLLDRRNNKVIHRSSPIDFPSLATFREELVVLFQQAGIGPTENQRHNMLWHENISPEVFRLLATGVGGDMLARYDAKTEAPDQLERAVNMSPESYLVQNWLGRLQFRNNRYRDSQNAYERALQINPTGVDALIWDTEAKVEIGDVQGADELVQRWATVLGKDSTLYRGALWQQAAEQSWSHEHKETAIVQLGRSKDFFHQGADSNRECRVSVELGRFYCGADQCEKAIGYIKQGVVLARQSKDLPDEVWSLFSLGDVYDVLNEFDKTIEYLNQALAILGSDEFKTRHGSNRRMEGHILAELSDAYQRTSRYEEAINYAERALTIARTYADHDLEESSFIGLGNAYERLGQYGKSLEVLDQTLRISKENTHDLQAESAALCDEGIIFNQLGEFDHAIDKYQQSLSIVRDSLHNRREEAIILNNIGFAYSKSERDKQAISYLEQALQLERAVNDQLGEGITILDLGEVYEHLQQFDKAVSYDEQSLALGRLVGEKATEGRALHDLGEVFFKLDDKNKSLDYFQQALTVRREIHEKAGEAATLRSLMKLWTKEGEKRLAIYYGKQSVNVHQGVRDEIHGMESDLQKAYLESNAGTYRELAELLAGEGNIAEAEHVLRLLKDEEYSEYVRDASVKSTETLQLNPHERAVQARYDELGQSLAAIGERLDVLSRKGQTGRSTEENAEWKDLNHKREEATGRFNDFLKGLRKEFAGQEDEAIRLNEITSGRSIMSTLSEFGPGAVAVYTLTAKGRYVVFLFTPNAQVSKEYAISSEELGKKITSFRAVLMSRGDPLPLAQELYRIVIGPIEKELKGANAKTIMWSLDGSLRYLPIAALHDGHEYMLERYQNVVFQPNRPLHTTVAAKWDALALGVSKAHQSETLQFSALVNVPLELRAIVKDDANRDGALPGMTKLDEQFTWDATLDELERRSHTVVHIASHFNFQAGDETASVLLLGDGNTLSLKKLKDQTNLFDKVDLLTLSACNTAMTGGDGKEVDGFAIVAQDEGANSVLATLWSVDDQSTSDLMRKFYELHESGPNMTKAEALRQAQLALLHGDIIALPDPKPTWTSNEQAASSKETQRSAWAAGTERTTSEPIPNRGYTHPYYWAPFILMGNWK
jgi:CHAT domain-containing protein/Tfp pilus assembly protein PilF